VDWLGEFAGREISSARPIPGAAVPVKLSFWILMLIG
jgi:hypothetical protein